MGARSLTRFVRSLLSGVVAIVLVLLAVANRHDVVLSFDPLTQDTPRWSVTAPMFWFLFAAVAFGVVIGGIAAWAKQGKWRKEARAKRREASRWHDEADRLKAATTSSPPALEDPDRRSAA